MRRTQRGYISTAIFCFAFLFLPVCLYSQHKKPQDLYWISYMTHAPGRGFYHMLIQINQLGDITEPPVRVSYVREPWQDSAIFIDDLGRLNLWAFYSHRALYRYILHRDVASPSITPIRRYRTNIKSNLPATRIYLTQRSRNNFLTISRVNNKFFSHLLGFKVGSKGELIEKPWEISAPDFNEQQSLIYGGVASEDGRVAFFNGTLKFRNELYLQSLNTSGIPTKKLLLIHQGTGTGHGRIPHASVSNVLPGEKRIVAFPVIRKSGGSYNDPDRLHVQAIDSDLSKRIGTPVPLQKPNEQFVGPHGIAIDPKGRFVVYVIEDSPTLYNAMIFQQLDGKGKPLGERTLLSDRCVRGIDMVQIPSRAFRN